MHAFHPEKVACLVAMEVSIHVWVGDAINTWFKSYIHGQFPTRLVVRIPIGPLHVQGSRAQGVICVCVWGGGQYYFLTVNTFRTLSKTVL